MSSVDIEKKIEKENIMGTVPVKQLLIKMSLPMMVSMLVQALYNVVDSIFVAKVSENALTAVSMAFPIQMLSIALGGGIGIGVNAILSRSLGEKNQENVNKSAMMGIFITIINICIMFLVGLFVVRPFYELQTDSAEIIECGVDYLSVVCCVSFGIFFQVIFERLLQSTGKTFYAMITQSTGAIVNLILDPIMIFGLFGFPALGVKGAAVATVTGQIIAACLAFYINITKNKEIQFRLKDLKPDIKMIGIIYSIGFPSIIMQSIGSVMVFCLNRILIGFSSTAVAVFGVYFKLQSFIFMPVFGLNMGIVPIVAYNYGAKNKKRMIDTIKYGMVVAAFIMICGTVVFELIPDVLFKMFSASDEMTKMGVVALRIIAVHFPVAALCIVIGSVFQALGNAVYSMLVSIARQIVVLIPAAALLARLGNVDYVWLAFPIAEIMSLIISTFFYIRVNKKIISRM